MPIVIREIVTEVVVRGSDEAAPSAAAMPGMASDDGANGRTDVLVRQAVERVLEILRRDWER